MGKYSIKGAKITKLYFGNVTESHIMCVPRSKREQKRLETERNAKFTEPNIWTYKFPALLFNWKATVNGIKTTGSGHIRPYNLEEPFRRADVDVEISVDKTDDWTIFDECDVDSYFEFYEYLKKRLLNNLQVRYQFVVNEDAQDE